MTNPILLCERQDEIKTGGESKPTAKTNKSPLLSVLSVRSASMSKRLAYP
jgi:hypothetical protein